MDPKAFPVQPNNIVPPACPPSSSRPPPGKNIPRTKFFGISNIGIPSYNYNCHHKPVDENTQITLLMRWTTEEETCQTEVWQINWTRQTIFMISTLFGFFLCIPNFYRFSSECCYLSYFLRRQLLLLHLCCDTLNKVQSLWTACSLFDGLFKLKTVHYIISVIFFAHGAFSLCTLLKNIYIFKICLHNSVTQFKVWIITLRKSSQCKHHVTNRS